MKRILLLTIALFSIGLAQAQEHMSFKGVPMDCDLTTFISKLNAIGYTSTIVQDDSAALEGDFAGKSDCTILVLGTAQTKQVWKVAVIFPEKSSWYSLKNEYRNMIESYTAKYGKPETYEYFLDPYYEGDGYELQAVKYKKCIYSAYFTASTGSINVYIDDTCCVMVTYEDGINVNLWKSEKENIIANDI